MKIIIPLAEKQIEEIRSPQDAITILRSVIGLGDQLFHPELNRIVTRCVVVLESGIEALTRQLQRAYPHGIPVHVVDPSTAYHRDHVSQTAGGYEPEPVESEE